MAKIIHIDSLTLPELEVYSRLTEAQLRNRLEPAKGIFIAESPKVIAVALDAGYEPLSLLMDQRHVEGLARPIIHRCGDEVPVYVGEGEMLSALTGFELTRGILCAMRRPLPLSIDEVCGDARRVVVMDAVVNATNTGAIFRAAAALGFDAALLSNTCSDPLNRRSVRVSMGTVFQLPWTYLGSLAHEGIDALHQLGFVVVGMALTDKSISIEDERLLAIERMAVVLGAEGEGLDQEVLERCDYVVRIPMMRGVDSLNVAGAAAVAFWQLRRR